MTICEKLIDVQVALKAPKNMYNDFGKYKYRNAESILEAAKPLLKEHGLTLVLSDEVTMVGERFYIKATAQIIDIKDINCTVTAQAYAREDLLKKGMDGSQITGTASSYARKYALNGLFLLDDTKDADADENHVECKNRVKGEKPKQEAPKPVEKTGPEVLSDMAFRDGVDIKKLCALYKVDSIEEFSEKKVQNAVGNWNKIMAMCKVSV